MRLQDEQSLDALVLAAEQYGLTLESSLLSAALVGKHVAIR